MPDRTLTFGVGTGRCGSTAMSRVFNRHPDVLSVNELLSSVVNPAAFGDGPISGPEFWGHLSRPNPTADWMLRSGAAPAEFLYHRRPGRRYSVETTGIPAISLMVLPHLTDDPDGLLDLLETEVTGWPTRPGCEQWMALFAALGAHLGGRRTVVERSGQSLNRVPQVRGLFPEARFVHLYRNGPDCALSMSRHFGFRMIMKEIADRCGLASPFELTPAHVAELPPDLAPLLSDRFDPALVWDRPIPVDYFGELWSQMILDGERYLGEVPASQRAALSYENLIDDPRGELKRFADFTGTDPLPEWLDTAAGLVDERRGAALTLPPADLAALRHACAPGMRALGMTPD